MNKDNILDLFVNALNLKSLAFIGIGIISILSVGFLGIYASSSFPIIAIISISIGYFVVSLMFIATRNFVVPMIIILAYNIVVLTARSESLTSSLTTLGMSVLEGGFIVFTIVIISIISCEIKKSEKPQLKIWMAVVSGSLLGLFSWVVAI